MKCPICEEEWDECEHSDGEIYKYFTECPICNEKAKECDHGAEEMVKAYWESKEKKSCKTCGFSFVNNPNKISCRNYGKKLGIDLSPCFKLCNRWPQWKSIDAVQNLVKEKEEKSCTNCGFSYNNNPDGSQCWIYGREIGIDLEICSNSTEYPLWQSIEAVKNLVKPKDTVRGVKADMIFIDEVEMMKKDERIKALGRQLSQMKIDMTMKIDNLKDSLTDTKALLADREHDCKRYQEMNNALQQQLNSLADAKMILNRSLQEEMKLREAEVQLNLYLESQIEHLSLKLKAKKQKVKSRKFSWYGYEVEYYE